MFKTLDQLADKLLYSYDIINGIWKTLDFFNPINLRKKSVADIQNNQMLWNSIL